MRTNVAPLRVAAWFLAITQIGATCRYSAPPLLSQGQGADTLDTGSLAIAAEPGWGAAGSWWKAENVGSPEVTDAWVGAGRLRLGLGRNIDLGVVGATGPEGTSVLGPEVKWRFAQLSEPDAEGSPGFHAALVSGLGIGTALYRYGSEPRGIFVAPYTGVLVSGGVQIVQMYSGLRIAGSETLGNHVTDFTLYPVLAFGIEMKPHKSIAFYAESDLAGGLTMTDLRDSAVMGYLCGGIRVTFGRLFGSDSAPAEAVPGERRPASTLPDGYPPANLLPASAPPTATSSPSLPTKSLPPASAPAATMASAGNPPASAPAATMTPAGNPPASAPAATMASAGNPPASAPKAKSPPASSRPASARPSVPRTKARQLTR